MYESYLEEFKLIALQAYISVHGIQHLWRALNTHKKTT